MRGHSLVLDLRDAFRTVSRSSGTTVIAILTLALAVGANTAVLSVFESILVNPLPYRHADRLVSVSADGTPGGMVSGSFAYRWTDRCPSITSVAVYTDGQLVLTGSGDADVLRGQRVNATFFDTLGVSPMLGRTFSFADDRDSANVVILSYDLWTTRFGADAGVVGRTYTMNGAPYRVIGVLGPEFHPFRMSNAAEAPRIFAPLGYNPDKGACRGMCASLHAVARLADDASIGRARGELDSTWRALRDERPAEFAGGSDLRLEPLHAQQTAALRPALWVAFAAAICVLLIACANVANLQLARAAARSGEFAVRGALGAGTARMARLLLLESGMIAIAGSVGGLLVGRFSLDALVSLAPRELPRLADIALDTRVLLITVGLGVATALAAGLAPAWLAARTDLNDVLKRYADRRAGHGSRARAVLVVAQVALAFVLVVAMGLLVRTVRGLLAVDAGFDSAHVLTMTPVVGAGGIREDAALTEKRQLIEAVEALPGVVATGVVNEVPLSHARPFDCEVEGAATPGVAPPAADVFWIDGDYLAALRIPLREGRLLTRHDGPLAPAALVSQSFVRHRFTDGRALGRRIRLADGPWLTIVGVVGDVRNVALDAPPDKAVYQPLAMNPGHYVRLVARTSGDPSILERPIRDVMRRIDPLAPIFHVQPMDDYVASSMAQRRFALALMTGFGALALVLACIGLYGVLTYTVVLRLPELGVRAALGATAGDLIRLVLRRGAALVGAGLAVGVVLAALSTQFLASLLFGVESGDAVTFGVGAGVIGAAGLLACALPARRAAQVDLLSIMRD